jgi:hypothetical protein
MKRAIRKDTMGEPVDSICGQLKGKGPRVKKPERDHFYIS